MKRAPVFAAFLAACLAAPALAVPMKDETAKADLMKIKDAYERAIREDKPELFTRYLADDFGGKMLFKDIRGKQGFNEFWNKVNDRLGKGENARGYSVTLKPEKIDVNGDTAKAEGTTEETVQTPLGQISYATTWKADLRRQGDGWKLTQMDSALDPKNTVSRFVASLVGNVWLKEHSIAPQPAAVGTAKDYRHRFRRVRAENPDFDGDR